MAKNKKNAKAKAGMNIDQFCKTHGGPNVFSELAKGWICSGCVQEYRFNRDITKEVLSNHYQERYILCQHCCSGDAGCQNCGGYGVVLEQRSCRCGRRYWVRPGAHTMYEGRIWNSFDGLRLSHVDGKTVCEHCKVIEEAGLE